MFTFYGAVDGATGAAVPATALPFLFGAVTGAATGAGAVGAVGAAGAAGAAGAGAGSSSSPSSQTDGLISKYSKTGARVGQTFSKNASESKVPKKSIKFAMSWASVVRAIDASIVRTINSIRLGESTFMTTAFFLYLLLSSL